MPAGALELGKRDRRPAPDALLRHARRPFEGATVGVFELKVRRGQPKALEALEEEAEPGGAAKLAVGDDLEADVLLPPDPLRDVAVEL